MAILVRKGGAWRTITAAQVFAGGAWRPLVAIKVRAGSTWRTVANFTVAGGGGGGGGTIALTISPSPFNGSARLATVSKDLTATPSGGLAPYTYLWTILSATGPATVTLANSTTATVTVSGNFTAEDTENITLRCTATDSLGTVAHTDVSGTLTRNPPLNIT